MRGILMSSVGGLRVVLWGTRGYGDIPVRLCRRVGRGGCGVAYFFLNISQGAGRSMCFWLK